MKFSYSLTYVRTLSQGFDGIRGADLCERDFRETAMIQL